MKRYNKRDNNRKTEMFDAVCSDCGKDCKVPFKPTSGKPIYCSSCFEKYDDKKSDNRKPRRDSRGSRSSSNNRDMHSAVCDKCGKDCKVPFKPSSDKPIYCSDCFEQVNENKSGANTELLEKIDKKLDYIVETLKYGKGRY
jgi:CxxC-x17-CxxC domain-containing protein